MRTAIFGINDLGSVATLAWEIDGPFNVVLVLGTGELDIRALLDVGVTRISVSGRIAQASVGLVLSATRELRGQNDLLCSVHLAVAKDAAARPNGGTARILPRPSMTQRNERDDRH